MKKLMLILLLATSMALLSVGSLFAHVTENGQVDLSPPMTQMFNGDDTISSMTAQTRTTLQTAAGTNSATTDVTVNAETINKMDALITMNRDFRRQNANTTENAEQVTMRDLRRQNQDAKRSADQFTFATNSPPGTIFTTVAPMDCCPFSFATDEGRGSPRASTNPGLADNFLEGEFAVTDVWHANIGEQHDGLMNPGGLPLTNEVKNDAGIPTKTYDGTMVAKKIVAKLAAEAEYPNPFA